MVKLTSKQKVEFQRELAEIQAEVDALEQEPTIDRARFEALKAKVEALKVRMNVTE